MYGGFNIFGIDNVEKVLEKVFGIIVKPRPGRAKEKKRQKSHWKRRK